MPTPDHLARFFRAYFSHKYFVDNPGGWLRLSLIPSGYLRAKIEGFKKKGGLKKYFPNGPEAGNGAVDKRLRVREVELKQEEVSEESVKKIIALNQKGREVYYFLNLVKRGLAGYCCERDIEKRLWFAVDLDFKLPCSWEGLVGEFGLDPGMVVKTSSRGGIGHHQIIWGLDCYGPEQEKGNKEKEGGNVGRLETAGETGEDLNNELRAVGRALCSCFSSDNISDAKRILRLPGLINWKGADRFGVGMQESELVWAAERVKVYELDEFEAAVERFSGSGLSGELRELGFKEVRLGGRAAGERGEYGSWVDALDRAREGKWTAGVGARHNALCSWGVQMAAARMPWGEVEKRMRELRGVGEERSAFEGGYSDSGNFEAVVRGVRRKWEEIDREVDDLISDYSSQAALEYSAAGPTLKVDGGGDVSHGNIGEIGASMINGIETTKDSYDSGDSSAPDLSGGGIVDTVGASESVGGDGDAVFQLDGPWDYSIRLARRGESESEAEWLDFLGRCLAAAILFERRDAASAVPLGRLLWERLRWARAVSDGVYCAPIKNGEPFDYWGVTPLGIEAARIMIKDFLFQVSEECKSKRKDLETHPAVVRANAGKKKKTYVFPGVGVMETKVVMDTLGRGGVCGLDNTEDGGIISFQNGYFDLNLWGSVNGAADSLRQKIERCWKPNGPIRCAGIPRSISWIRWHHSCAVNFNLEAALLCAEGESLSQESMTTSTLGLPASRVAMPQMDYFVRSSFNNDEGDIVGLFRIIGYCLLPDNPCQKYFYFEGLGGTGKGTTAEIILALAGKSRAGRLDINRFESDAWLGPLEARGPVLIDEAETVTPALHKKALIELARVTGEPAVASRALHKDARQIRSTQKFILTTNKGLDTEDESGQQARRIVPIHFKHRPKGNVIPNLWRDIVIAEGSMIATRAVLELARVWHQQEGLFSVGLEGAAAFTSGKERFRTNTGGLREFLGTVVKGAEVPLSSALLGVMCEIWISQEEGRRHLLAGQGGLASRVKSEMEQLTYEWKEKVTYPIPDKAVGKYGRLRGAGFPNAAIDMVQFLEETGLSEEQFIEVFADKVGVGSKEWFLAEVLLELKEKGLFERRSVGDSWESWEGKFNI